MSADGKYYRYLRTVFSDHCTPRLSGSSPRDKTDCRRVETTAGKGWDAATRLCRHTTLHYFTSATKTQNRRHTTAAVARRSKTGLRSCTLLYCQAMRTVLLRRLSITLYYLTGVAKQGSLAACGLRRRIIVTFIQKTIFNMNVCRYIKNSNILINYNL